MTSATRMLLTHRATNADNLLPSSETFDFSADITREY